MFEVYVKNLKGEQITAITSFQNLENAKAFFENCTNIYSDCYVYLHKFSEEEHTLLQEYNTEYTMLFCE